MLIKIILIGGIAVCGFAIYKLITTGKSHTSTLLIGVLMILVSKFLKDRQRKG
ncbi:MAG: hypothetical protein K2X86_13485 [Cytophagaceae bacterium]|nr:hypothetical protein [Cytophagaceae bacterium]